MTASTPPGYRAAHFTCPHCGVDAQQKWQQLAAKGTSDIDGALMRSKCINCDRYTYWVDESMVWPELQFGDPPAPEMTDEQRGLYEEARAVAARSPRSACALLRLLVERIVLELTPESRRFTDGIDDLFDRREITRKIVDAMDAVRLRGNGAVHGGHIDPTGEDDERVVLLLFRLANDIVEATKGLADQTDALLGGKRRPDPGA